MNNVERTIKYLGKRFVHQMEDALKVKNGLCEHCANATCKRNQKTNRKECNNFVSI